MSVAVNAVASPGLRATPDADSVAVVVIAHSHAHFLLQTQRGWVAPSEDVQHRGQVLAQRAPR